MRAQPQPEITRTPLEALLLQIKSTRPDANVKDYLLKALEFVFFLSLSSRLSLADTSPRPQSAQRRCRRKRMGNAQNARSRRRGWCRCGRRRTRSKAQPVGNASCDDPGRCSTGEGALYFSFSATRRRGSRLTILSYADAHPRRYLPLPRPDPHHRCAALLQTVLQQPDGKARRSSEVRLSPCLFHIPTPPSLPSLTSSSTARRARAAFYTAKSDLLSDQKAFEACLSARKEGNAALRAFTESNFISPSTFRDVLSLRTDYLSALSSVGFISTRARADDAAFNENSQNENLLKAIIFAGTARLVRVKLPKAVFDKGIGGAIERERESREVKFYEPAGAFLSSSSLSGSY